MIPLCSPKEARTPTAIALGSFDGLHPGHRLVIDAAVKNSPGVPSVVSFWPHPREVLFNETRLRLDLPEEKLSLLQPMGIEQLVLVPFNSELAELSAAAFIDQVLRDILHAKRIAVGANFRFGKDRLGDVQMLSKLGEKAGIEINIVPILKDQQGRISSSRIRSALSAADLLTAKELLNRPYRFAGQVVHGRGIGKTLGWPTANLQVDGRKFLPCLGVYAAWAWVNQQLDPLPAVMNLGPQPTVDPNSPSAVEVHILDQQIDLENCKLLVEPVCRLRGQQRFKKLSALSAQIGIDAESARNSLRSNKKESRT